jgi:hypothetical protein
VLEVGLCGSKTAGHCPERLVVPTKVCQPAVDAIQQWVVLAGVEEGQPILRGLARSGSVRPERLHANSVSGIVRRAVIRHLLVRGSTVEDALRQAKGFSGHSGRVGLYVTATEAGIPAQHIAALARHKSMAMVLRYARMADQLACSPHVRPGGGA